MNAERAFQDLGIDAVTGVQLMDMLQVSIDELHDPRRFSKLKDVINYFKQFSPDTQRFLINKATMGKIVDKLDQVYEYSKLLETKLSIEQSINEAEKERSAVEISGDPILMTNISQKQMDLRQRLANVTEEIGIYEK